MKAITATTAFTAALLLAAAGSLSAESCEDTFCIDWWSIASGGEIQAESSDGQWRLSGTIGQWDATEARELSGEQWRVTGGFWGMTLEELADRLFGDRFEDEGA
jgi:hypothetical protein